MQNPQITLIGAGPGDPELITVKALRALEAAEVVLYDALVNPALLDIVPAKAPRIPVGKRAGQPSAKQEDINRQLVEAALVYGHAVRLKGGDPMLFARGAEEWAYAQEVGIPVSVIPGISSIQLPGLYGIPLTARGLNTGFRVVTATNRFGALTNDLRLAATDGQPTVVFMGLKKVPAIAAEYLRHGFGELPVVVISQGSSPQAQVLYGTLATLEAKLETNPLPAPALLVIGENVALSPAWSALQSHQNLQSA